MLPTEVMDRPAWRFWMDCHIRAAGVQFENEAQQQGGTGSAGVASEREQRQVVQDQEARADRRDAADGQPDLQEQLEALEAQDGSGRPQSGGQ